MHRWANRKSALVLWVLAAAVLAGCAGQADDAGKACKLVLAGELPMRNTGRQVLTEVRINEKPALLMFDTGAFTSVLSDAASKRLGLTYEASDLVALKGIGGIRGARFVSAQSVDIGGLRGRKFYFLTASIPFGDGILSADILSKYDIDIDYPGARIGLYQAASACGRPLTAMQEPVYSAPLLPGLENKMPKTVVSIGGQTLTALVDTGAETTAIYRDAVRKIGLDIDILAGDPSGFTSGVGPHKVRAVQHVIKAITIGELTIRNLPVTIIDQSSDGDSDMLLGADFQKHVHVWISNSSHTLIMQYPPQPSPPPQTSAP